MFKTNEKYHKLFLLGIQRAMEYRVNFFLGFLACIFPLIIQFFLWQAVFKSAATSTVYGYTFIQILIYSTMAGIVTKTTGTGFHYEVHEEIKTGGFSKYLILPVYFFSFRLFIMLGEKVVEFVISLVLVAALLIGFYFFANVPLSVFNIAVFCLSFFMGIILNFIIFYGVCSFTFRFSNVSYFFEAIRIILLVFSGGILPLDIFGERMLFILRLFPFQYTAYFPINLLTGKYSPAEMAAGLAIQLGWIIVGAFVINLLWDQSTKKYVSYGG